MHETEDDEDPFGPALDALKAADLIPRPISDYQAGELDGVDGVGILHHHGALTPEQLERITLVMGDLPYVLVEVMRDPDGTTRRVDDGRVIGRPLYHRGPYNS